VYDGARPEAKANRLPDQQAVTNQSKTNQRRGRGPEFHA
jgi:hypothetical protein